MSTLREIFSIILLGGFLLCSLPLYSQDEFVQFTRFDQLHWSPSGEQLAFRSVLLDEAKPDHLTINALMVDLRTDQLICLNPRPERFKISFDKKYLLFSDNYGLYLMRLDAKAKTVQLVFRNPTANWLFTDFGFLQDNQKIYLRRLDVRSNQINKEKFRIEKTDFSSSVITRAKIQSITGDENLSHFDLPLCSLDDAQNDRVAWRDYILKFAPKRGLRDVGNYQLQFQTSESTAPKILVDSCRPRLMCLSPDSTRAVISLFKDKGHKSYLFSFLSGELSFLEDTRYFSVAWLDSSRYIYLTEEGLFLHNICAQNVRKLNTGKLPEWCQTIGLQPPKFELQVGFAENEKQAKQMVERLHQLGYPARKVFFQNQDKKGYRIRVGGFTNRRHCQEYAEKLAADNYPCWIDNIDDLFDYFNALIPNEKKCYGGKCAIIQYQKDIYLSSRIVLIDKDGKQRIIVDEMINGL